MLESKDTWAYTTNALRVYEKSQHAEDFGRLKINLLLELENFSERLLSTQKQAHDKIFRFYIFRIRSGLLDVRKLISQQIKVGLGTGKV